jgi:hypothetical protein
MKRYSGSYQVQLSYTLSRAMDNGDAQLSTDSIASAIYPPNPYDLGAEWAAAPFDAPHVFAANATWELPSRNHPLLAGWQLNGIVAMHSGYAFSPSIQTPNWSRTGNISNNAEDRPNVKPGTDPKKIITGNPNGWFDTSAFELPLQGTNRQHATELPPRPRLRERRYVARQEPAAARRHEAAAAARSVQRAQSRELRHADPAGVRRRESE